jgi:hypothetical protein
MEGTGKHGQFDDNIGPGGDSCSHGDRNIGYQLRVTMSWHRKLDIKLPIVPNYGADSIQQGSQPAANMPRNRKEKF